MSMKISKPRICWHKFDSRSCGFELR